MIRVLLADDHALVRAGLRKILEGFPDIQVVGEASTGEEAVALAKRLKPDVVVMDMSMPGIGGLEATKRIASSCPEIGVLVLTIYPEKRFGLRFLKAGARGYVEKRAAPENLVTAIRRVFCGGFYLSPDLQDDVLRRQFGRSSTQAPDLLSDRELEILLLIANGKTTKEVAEELKLSPKTVHTYRTRIRKKLGLRTGADYLRFAIDNHLLPVNEAMTMPGIGR